MPAVPFARLAQEILVLYSPPRRAPATRRQMAQVLREFAAVPRLAKTSDLRPPAIAAWMDMHPARTAVTTQSLLRCLRAICKYAVAQGYLDRSPFDFWKPAQWIRADAMPAASRPARHRTPADIARVLARADQEAAGGAWVARRLRALVYLYAFTGVRAEEALHLRVDDVDLRAMILTIAPHDGWRPKTLKSAARLPIAAPLADALQTWLPHTGCRWLFPGVKLLGPWLHGTTGYKPLDHVRALGERAGVEGLTIIGFRKTIGTYAKTWGFSQLELKALLRHSQIETQRWYDEEDLDAMRPSILKIKIG